MSSKPETKNLGEFHGLEAWQGDEYRNHFGYMLEFLQSLHLAAGVRKHRPLKG